MIRNILGGFLFTGDDIYKKAGVLSGGERTRLAVARMLLRPSNTLLLDEPTNHLDLDSKDVLLEALEDYGGTLIIVSHDRYFVEKLATKIIEIGHGQATVYPGTYPEYLWHKEKTELAPAEAKSKSTGVTSQAAETPPQRSKGQPSASKASTGAPAPQTGRREAQGDREERKRRDAERRSAEKAQRALQTRLADLEARIAEREQQIKEIEATMSAPGFYDDHLAAKPIVDRHQALMWEVGDLIGQWEALQEHAAESQKG
jgi:ATP-binding cassette subfamily F protein 3